MAGAPHLLMLLRHAIAEDRSDTGRDQDRRLTGEGKRKLRDVVAGMRALELPVERVVSSPLRRARETAEIVAEGYGLDGDVDVSCALEPGAGPDAALAALAGVGRPSGVVLVGHEPDLAALASTLLAGTPGLVRMGFRKAGLAGIVVATLPPRSAGTLEFFLTPGQLRRIGGA
ncbi:MAG: histidine phosphatase family protein [Deltaproteobacteria bacterium]|nr:histidine phosphatase family protein [Deltaproteobacteria bacterium]